MIIFFEEKIITISNLYIIIKSLKNKYNKKIKIKIKIKIKYDKKRKKHYKYQ